MLRPISRTSSGFPKTLNMNSTGATPILSIYPTRGRRDAGIPGNDSPNSSILSAADSTQETSIVRPQGQLEANDTGFSQILANAQQRSVSARPPVSRWRSLSFLDTYAAPHINWPWIQTVQDRVGNLVASGVGTISDVIASQVSPPLDQATRAPLEAAQSNLYAASAPRSTGQGMAHNQPLVLADYPHPPGDNGRGIHWIPTVSQSPDVVDRFVEEAQAMGMKWVVFLNEGTDVKANDYLVKRLVQAGIEPVMRVYTPGLVPIEGDLKSMVRHYVDLGVNYFQLYNEPNLMVETNGQPPNVDHYLDLWIPAAMQVIEAGGLPGFGALSPQGEVDDREFLRQALDRLKARDRVSLLDRAWLAMHNYTGPRPLNDPDGFLRFRQYDTIVRAALGRSLPIIGTEGGTHTSEQVSEEQQIAMVTGAYNYMRHREPYNFAYTYWIIANGHDPAWDQQALIRPEGPTALAQALRTMA